MKMKTPLDQTPEMSLLEGGPVTLPVSRLHHLARLSSAASAEVDCAVRVILPRGSGQLSGEWDKTRLRSAQDKHGLTFTGRASINHTDPFLRLGVALANAQPPEGTHIAMAAFCPSRPSSRPTFAGTLSQGLLLVEIVFETPEIADLVFSATEHFAPARSRPL